MEKEKTAFTATAPGTCRAPGGTEQCRVKNESVVFQTEAMAGRALERVFAACTATGPTSHHMYSITKSLMTDGRSWPTPWMLISMITCTPLLIFSTDLMR